MVEKLALKRLPRDDEDQPRYFHPNGYVIVRCRRTWSERGRERMIADPPPALYWWEIHEHVAPRASSLPTYRLWAHKTDHCTETATLREAREWCDERPRYQWSAAGVATALNQTRQSVEGSET